jgi:multicomponent Na+:H+ antiporter subunit D
MAQRLQMVDPRARASAAVLLFAALALKLGLFPFHAWVPPVYRNARPVVAAMFAGALANIGSYGLIRFAGELLPREVEWASVLLLTIGAASIVYGGLAAAGSDTSGNVLAYSSIGQAGFIVMAVAIGGSAGVAGAVAYAVVNALQKTLLFLASGIRGPFVGPAFAAGAFSLAGVPPLGGFVSKAAVLRATIEAGSAWATVALVAGTALSFVYIFRLYQREFWAGAGRADAGGAEGLARAVPAALGVVLIAAGVWPQPLLAAGLAAAAALEGME